MTKIKYWSAEYKGPQSEIVAAWCFANEIYSYYISDRHPNDFDNGMRYQTIGMPNAFKIYFQHPSHVEMFEQWSAGVLNFMQEMQTEEETDD